MNPDTTFVERIFGLIDKMAVESCDQESIAIEIRSISNECGYEFYTITRLPQPKMKLGPEMLLKRWPDSWLIHYDRNHYYANDPIGKHCFETHRPFLWSDVRRTEWDDQARRIMNEAEEHGLREGFCVPIIGSSGSQAVASFAGERPCTSPAKHKALHLLAIASYDWAEHQNHRQSESPRTALSPRERDVLTWTAVGLTNSEVASKLGVSVLTVRTHIERARWKLGAANSVNAVVQALKRREIKI